MIQNVGIGVRSGGSPEYVLMLKQRIYNRTLINIKNMMHFLVSILKKKLMAKVSEDVPLSGAFLICYPRYCHESIHCLIILAGHWSEKKSWKVISSSRSVESGQGNFESPKKLENFMILGQNYLVMRSFFVFPAVFFAKNC